MHRLPKKMAHKMKRSAGFTLLEILVVLTIMGFLIAMVAPRLAGISSSAVDTVCDTNQARMTTMMSAYFEQKGSFPSYLTNLICENGARDANGVAAGYLMPTTDDGDDETGPGVFAEEFVERNKFALHFLNADEVKELKEMGVRFVYNLNDYTDPNSTGPNQAVTPKAPFMAKQELAPGVAVLMTGAGAATAAAELTVSDQTSGWGEPNWVGRIVMGFGPENGLITSGLVSNAAHCPGGIQNSDNITYNDYNLVLPRLKSTVKRGLADGIIGTITTAQVEAGDELEYKAVAYTDDTKPAGGTYTFADGGLKYRIIKWVGQENYAYATQCPEGHMFPADDEDYWALCKHDDPTVAIAD